MPSYYVDWAVRGRVKLRADCMARARAAVREMSLDELLEVSEEHFEIEDIDFAEVDHEDDDESWDDDIDDGTDPRYWRVT